MEITRDMLLARIEALKADLATCQKQIILFDGALQDAEYWLKEFDKSEQAQENTNA